MINSSENITSVHMNKNYSANEVRHLNIYPSMQSSVSGQYESTNFQELVKRIKEVHEGVIYFIDTRKDTHFVLNNSVVCLKADDNSQLTAGQIIQKEAQLVNNLLGKMLTFKSNRLEDRQEEVTSSSTIQQFVEDKKYWGMHLYLRFALERFGPPNDSEVDAYLLLLEKIKNENAWLHANSVVGGDAAMLLIVMEDLLANAAHQPLNEILVKHGRSGDFLKTPKEDDENASKKIDRAAFLEKFHMFAKNRSEHSLSWSEWKTRFK
ncbi:MAG: hypothetical protein H0V82_11455 [Candidatus Protochlamydia sp.]|nr:hypothetical protein [Candidatus Protochlamydia sp.]